MDFFEDLTQKTAKLIADVAESVKGFADQAGNAANKTVDIIKIKGTIEGSKAEVKKLYYELGQKVYENYKDAINPDKDDPVDQICAQIKTRTDQIDTLRKQLEAYDAAMKEEREQNMDQAQAAGEDIEAKVEAAAKKLDEELEKIEAENKAAEDSDENSDDTTDDEQ